MSGVTDLEELIHSLRPEPRDGEFVVVVSDGRDLDVQAVIREDEGTTLVLRREDADAAGLAYDFVAAWITLTVHSDLAAVGLTAAVSTALADAGISCNVLAGFHHDHLLVPADRRDDALEVLGALTEQ
ncbi:ACT domain-containing protein [Pseudolysinimonas sp.]|jgi:hypothetical protein|uniref:ACT domain-containing protein n=1 Tax=Pseudolysinimonas sp. TaxID=2680009 RepID=UPI003784E697